MNEQDFLEYLKDPVAASIEKGVDEFHVRWNINIDVLNLMETKGRSPNQPRHWLAHIFTTDELLIRSFTDSFIHYITKHHPSAWITVGRYQSETNLLPMGILEYKQ